MEQGANQFGISTSNPLFTKADALAKLIYKICGRFPKHEMFGLTAQLRRAGLSVILNIIEGFARQSNKEYQRISPFLNHFMWLAKRSEIFITACFRPKTSISSGISRNI